MSVGLKSFNTLKVILQRAFSRVLTTSNFIANKITEQTPLLQSFFYIGIGPHFDALFVDVLAINLSF